MKNFVNRRGKNRGFTLIELLVVVLILAILMAVALPLYLSAVADSERKTCRSNLQTVCGAVHAYRVKVRSSTVVPTFAMLVPDLPNTPICPAGGVYSIGGAAQFNAACTLHGSFTPGVDGS